MSDSEVFNLYAELVEQQDQLIANAAKKKEFSTRESLTSSMSKKKDDLSIYEIMYGIKPKDLGADYENNLMEAAHRQPVIVGPSYDKINGLVENNIERQNIIVNLLNKKPDGIHTTHKLASLDLMKQLYRIAEHCDSKDQEQLTKLADICLKQLHSKSIEKTAFEPITMTAIGIAALLGFIAYNNNAEPVDQKLLSNITSTISELKDLTEGHGYFDWMKSMTKSDTSKELDKQLKLCISQLESLYTAYEQRQKYEGIIPDDVQNAKEALEIIQQPAFAQYKSSAEKFISKVKQVMPIIKRTIEMLVKQKSSSKKEHTSNWLARLNKATELVTGNDFDDAIRYLSMLGKSCVETLKEVEKAKQYMSDLQNGIITHPATEVKKEDTDAEKTKSEPIKFNSDEDKKSTTESSSQPKSFMDAAKEITSEFSNADDSKVRLAALKLKNLKK